jgi:hypothetical protein
MPPYGQSLYVLEDEIVGTQFRRQANELQQEAIAGIVQCSFPHEREALTRCAAEYHVDHVRCRVVPPCGCRAPVRAVASPQMEAHLGKLNSWTAQCTGSISTAARTSNPACSKPSDNPPAPAKRSTPIGRLRLILSPQETHRYALPTFCGFFNSHCQIVRILHPNFLSCCRVRRSRATFVQNFFCQNAGSSLSETWHSGIADGGARSNRLRKLSCDGPGTPNPVCRARSAT